MPPGTEQPLIAHDHTSEQSIDAEGGLEEEDALLTGQKTASDGRYDGGFWRQVALLAWAVLATIVAVVLAALFQQQKAAQGDGADKDGTSVGKRNLIFMVSDGMGPASLALTREFRQTVYDLPINDTLLLDEHLIGTSRTRSTSSLITDSAAGATAFSCGDKSYNGAISVLPDHTPCGTVLEAAKLAGYMTGLVVTTRLTDATPACFASHVQQRDYEDNIAKQMVGLTHPLGRVVDLLFGGGRCHFISNSSSDGSCHRDDDEDIIAQAQQKKNWSYISTPNELDELASKPLSLPLLGLFAPTDIPYEIDRRHEDLNTTFPSLAQMAQVALDLLSRATRDSDKGFFLMIEGSRIDHAGHSNDPGTQVHEVMAYDDAFATVVNFLDSNEDDVPSVLVGTSDHETGGLSLARQLEGQEPIYEWHPDVLAKASHSARYLSTDLHSHFPLPPIEEPLLGPPLPSTKKLKEMEGYINETTLAAGLGITDPSRNELDRILSSLTQVPIPPSSPDGAVEPWGLTRLLADMLSRRSLIGWGSHGHSGVDVNIYGAQSHVRSHPHALRPVRRNRENTEIGDFLAKWLGVDGGGEGDGVDGVTASLKSWGEGKGHGGWMGSIPE